MRGPLRLFPGVGGTSSGGAADDLRPFVDNPFPLGDLWAAFSPFGAMGLELFPAGGRWRVY